MSNKRKAEVKTARISTSVGPPSTTGRRCKRRRKKVGDDDEQGPPGVRECGIKEAPRRAPKNSREYVGPITILYKTKKILEVEHNTTISHNVTSQRTVTLSVVYDTEFQLLKYFNILYLHMVATFNTIYSTWQNPALESFLDRRDNAEMKLNLETNDDASRLWIHYMFLRLYEDTTRTRENNIHREHEQIYFTYALLLAEEQDNKPSMSEDPVVVHLAHTLFRKLGYNEASVQIALHQWQKHARTNTLIATEDPTGVEEAVYYSSLVSAFNELNSRSAEGSATRILATESRCQEFGQEDYEAPGPTICTCVSCNTKTDPAFHDLREIFRVLRQTLCHDATDLIAASHPAIINGVQEYGTLGMHFLQLMARCHTSHRSHLPLSFLTLLNFMGQWVECQSLKLGGIPGIPNIDQEDDQETDSETDATEEPEEENKSPIKTKGNVVHHVVIDDDDDTPLAPSKEKKDKKEKKETKKPVTLELPPKDSLATLSKTSKDSLPGRQAPTLPAVPTKVASKEPVAAVLLLPVEESSAIQVESTIVPVHLKDADKIPAKVTDKILATTDKNKPSQTIPVSTPSCSSSTTDTPSSGPTFEEGTQLIPGLTKEQFQAMVKSGLLQKLLASNRVIKSVG